MHTWDRRPNETSRAYDAFCAYIQLGPQRSLTKLCTALERPTHYLSQLKGWSSLNDWVNRASAFDTRELTASLEARVEVRERARQYAVDRVAGYLERIDALADDENTPPSVVLSALRSLVEIAGVTAPKRVELSGPDGAEVRIASLRTGLDALTLEQLAAIAGVLGDGDGDDEGDEK